MAIFYRGKDICRIKNGGIMDSNLIMYQAAWYKILQKFLLIERRGNGIFKPY